MSKPKSSSSQRPESVSAIEADKRVSTADGRPGTSSKLHLVAENTTHDVTPSQLTTALSRTLKTVQSDSNRFRSDPAKDDVNLSTSCDLQGQVGADPGSEKPEDILEEDELFMTLSEAEKEEWERMLALRSRKLDQSEEQHKKWAESFTRRRMFSYSRMRKLHISYRDRLRWVSELADTLKHIQEKRSNSTSSHKGKVLAKHHSDPVMSKSVPTTGIGNKVNTPSIQQGETSIKGKTNTMCATGDTSVNTDDNGALPQGERKMPERTNSPSRASAQGVISGTIPTDTSSGTDRAAVTDNKVTPDTNTDKTYSTSLLGEPIGASLSTSIGSSDTSNSQEKTGGKMLDRGLMVLPDQASSLSAGMSAVRRVAGVETGAASTQS